MKNFAICVSNLKRLEKRLFEYNFLRGCHLFDFFYSIKLRDFLKCCNMRIVNKELFE